MQRSRDVGAERSREVYGQGGVMMRGGIGSRVGPIQQAGEMGHGRIEHLRARFGNDVQFISRQKPWIQVLILGAQSLQP